MKYIDVLHKLAAAGNLGWQNTGSERSTEDWLRNDVLKGGQKQRLMYGGIAALLFGGANALRRGLSGKRVRLRDWLVPGMLGFAGGNLYGLGKDMLAGQAYNRNYDVSKLKDGDTVFIGVSGGGDGPGSELDKAMRDKLGAGNYAMFRHGDTEQLKNFVSSLPKGVKPVMIGHSWGGHTISSMQNQFGRNDIDFHTIDPVSWRGKLTGMQPAGTLYLPDNKVKDRNNLIAQVGGRWAPKDYSNTRYYHGGHSKGVESLMTDDILQRYLPAQ